MNKPKHRVENRDFRESAGAEVALGTQPTGIQNKPKEDFGLPNSENTCLDQSYLGSRALGDPGDSTVKSPTYEPSSCELSKMRTCVCMSNHVKLVHVSGVYCHVCASSTSGCAFGHFTVQYCIEYSSTVSLFQAQDVWKQV